MTTNDKHSRYPPKTRNLGMDRFQKFSVYLLIVLTFTVSFEIYHVMAGPSPTINRVVTPGAIGPCTWFVSLDGSTPVAEAMVGGLSVSPGDNVVGTVGHFGTLWLTIIAASESICVGDGTFTLDSGDLGANLGLPVYSNDRIILSRGTVINQVAGQYLGNLNGADQKKGIFVNVDTTNGNPNIEITGGKIVGTQANAANTSFTNCIDFYGASLVWVHDIIADGCGIKMYATTSGGSSEPITLIGGQGLTIERITFQHSVPLGISLANVARVIIDGCLVKSDGSIDDIVNISNSAEDVSVFNNYFDKFLSDGVHTSTGQPLRFQGNNGAWGYADVYVRDNDLINATNTAGGQFGVNVQAYGRIHNFVISGNLFFKNYFGANILAQTASIADGIIFSDNDVYSSVNLGVQIEIATTAAKLVIANNRIFDNVNGGGGTPFGLRLLADVSGAYGSLIITGNAIFDNRTSVKQTNSIQFDSAGAGWVNTIISNNVLNQTAINVPACCPTNLIISNNLGYDPVGKLSAPFTTSPPELNPFGANAAPTASTNYVVQGPQVFVTSTGGTGVSINISCGGNNLVAAAATLTNQLIPQGCAINFGGFSVAPTVTVFAN